MVLAQFGTAYGDGLPPRSACFGSHPVSITATRYNGTGHSPTVARCPRPAGGANGAHGAGDDRALAAGSRGVLADEPRSGAPPTFGPSSCARSWRSRASHLATRSAR